MDGGGFGGVVGLGAGAVGGDVADFVGCGGGVGDGLAHGRGGSVGEGLGDVAGVGGEAEADDLGVDGGVAGLGGGERFEGEHGGAFTDGHAVAVGGEGAALRGGDDAHGVPGPEEAERQRGFVTAGDGGVDHSTSHHLEGEADGGGAGGAGGRDVEAGTGELCFECDVGGSGAC